MKLNNTKRPLHTVLLTTMLAGVSTHASAVEPTSPVTAVMEWKGTVPGATASNVIIKGPTGLPLSTGTLEFALTADGKGRLSDSRPIEFNVFAFSGGDVGAAVHSYTYNVVDFTVNGIKNPSNSYFALSADGSPVKIGDDYTKNGVTSLNVVASGALTPTDQPVANQNVSIAANVMIKNFALTAPAS
ncbi:hypothetical protein ACEUAY_11655 [Aeromonas veronii]